MAKRPNQISQMLNDPNKGIHKTYGSIGGLSRMFRVMLKDLNIGGYQFNLLMTKFLSDPRNNIPDNKKDQTSNRGNLNKEFQRGQMTWKVFCKALRFLQYKNIKLTIEGERPNGQIMVHSIKLPMSVVEPELDENDERLAEDMETLPYLDPADEE